MESAGKVLLADLSSSGIWEQSEYQIKHIPETELILYGAWPKLTTAPQRLSQEQLLGSLASPEFSKVLVLGTQQDPLLPSQSKIHYCMSLLKHLEQLPEVSLVIETASPAILFLLPLLKAISDRLLIVLKLEAPMRQDRPHLLERLELARTLSKHGLALAFELDLRPQGCLQKAKLLEVIGYFQAEFIRIRQKDRSGNMLTKLAHLDSSTTAQVAEAA